MAANAAARAVHAGFLVDSQQHLQRRMDQARRFQRGQRERDADAVVRAQRRVLSDQPAITHHHIDRVALEVVLCSDVGLAHHVEMALQDHAGHRLAAGAGRLFQDQVARIIDDGSDAARLRPADQVFA